MKIAVIQIGLCFQIDSIASSLYSLHIVYIVLCFLLKSFLCLYNKRNNPYMKM